jgi:hypothetical protein
VHATIPDFDILPLHCKRVDSHPHRPKEIVSKIVNSVRTSLLVFLSLIYDDRVPSSDRVRTKHLIWDPWETGLK